MDEDLRQSGESLSGLEVDTIGEILNISMGSAATAISTLLDKQVMISTPNVVVRGFSSLDYAELEPSMLVKINYVEGISGCNVMIFKQNDMQVILSLLMGSDDEPTEDFVFDELAISAACEVMNQMMGASATALADFLGLSINISTPEAITVDSDDAYRQAVDVAEGDEIVSVSFRLMIDGVMDSNFASVLTIDLARDIIRLVMGEQERAMESIEPQTRPQPAVPAVTPSPAPEAPVPIVAPVAQPAYASPPAPQADMPPAYAPPPATYTQQPPMQQAPEVYGAYPPPAAYAPPYYAPPQDMMYQQPAAARQPVNVQTPQFPAFAPGMTQNPATNSNMDLLMRVSLDVSVEIGKTKRKIKDILDFGQGTVIELNKQAGAPVDIVVNGCLLARGDVVVIDDNFGVRVTEIVGAKELMDTLKEENGL